MSTFTGNPFLERGEADLREGIAILGDSPAADRLNETLELIQFLTDETRAMMRRWHERKAVLRARPTADRAITLAPRVLGRCAQPWYRRGSQFGPDL